MEEITRVFKALSDPTRFKIFLLLSKRRFCVNAIVRSLNISQPAVSQHLRILREAGLVEAEKRGYWMHYSANRERAGQTMEKFSRILGGEQDVPKSGKRKVSASG